jgi:hypothetical protein
VKMFPTLRMLRVKKLTLMITWKLKKMRSEFYMRMLELNCEDTMVKHIRGSKHCKKRLRDVSK